MMKTVKEVKKLVSEHMSDREQGISVSLWQDNSDDKVGLDAAISDLRAFVESIDNS